MPIVVIGENYNCCTRHSWRYSPITAIAYQSQVVTSFRWCSWNLEFKKKIPQERVAYTYKFINPKSEVQCTKPLVAKSSTNLIIKIPLCFHFSVFNSLSLSFPLPLPQSQTDSEIEYTPPTQQPWIYTLLSKNEQGKWEELVVQSLTWMTGN